MANIMAIEETGAFTEKELEYLKLYGKGIERLSTLLEDGYEVDRVEEELDILIPTTCSLGHRGVKVIYLRKGKMMTTVVVDTAQYKVLEKPFSYVKKFSKEVDRRVESFMDFFGNGKVHLDPKNVKEYGTDIIQCRMVSKTSKGEVAINVPIMLEYVGMLLLEAKKEGLEEPLDLSHRLEDCGQMKQMAALREAAKTIDGHYLTDDPDMRADLLRDIQDSVHGILDIQAQNHAGYVECVVRIAMYIARGLEMKEGPSPSYDKYGDRFIMYPVYMI